MTSDVSPHKAATAAAPSTCTDVFRRLGTSSSALHPRFRMLRDLAEFAPARKLISMLCGAGSDKLAVAYRDRLRECDFDAALLELYVVGLGKEAGHRVRVRRRGHPLELTKAGVTVTMDVATVGQPCCGLEPDASTSAPHSKVPAVPGVGDCLMHTLNLLARDTSHAGDRPFVLVIQDFEHPAPHRDAPSAVLRLLFDGSQRSSELHELFPRGLFRLVEAKDLSGVLFCDDATIGKFNRLGLEEFGSSEARMLRHGVQLDEHGGRRESAGYVYEVGDRGGQREHWNEGTVFIRNPFARHQLPPGWLGASAEIDMHDGSLSEQLDQGFHPLLSHTELMRKDVPAWWVEQRSRLIQRELAGSQPTTSAG